MYQRSASVYDALNRHKDYASAAASLIHTLRPRTGSGATLLDVACGTGRHLEHLRDAFVVTGLDGSAEMLAIAATRCPGVVLHRGDLRNFQLARRFDVITCLFGSIAYAITLEELNHAIDNMAAHLVPGGVLVVEPWLTPDRFVSGRLVFDRVDDDDLKVARMYVTRREERMSVYDMDYLVGRGGDVIHFTEEERLGLFTHEEYQRAFHLAGLPVTPDGDLFGYGLLIGEKPR
jgi:SAM-dependent methyltransferase